MITANTDQETTTTSTAVTVDAAVLLRVIANVALFACTDNTLPAICTVRLTADGGTLTAEATDRYVYARETVECGPGTLELLADAKPLLAAVKPFAAVLKDKHLGYLAEKPAIAVTADGAYVKLTLSGILAPDMIVTAPICPGQFPRHASKMLDEHEAKDGQESNGHTTLAAIYLAALAKVADDAGLRSEYRGIRLITGGPGKPSVVHVGGSFRALVMPYGKD